MIDVSEHFLVHEKTPTLLLVLRYRELPDNGGGTRSSPEAARKDWRAELDGPGQKIYDEFRLWRGRKAKHEGLPPYLILNNRELAEFAMKRPANISQLREIEGIGEAKAKRWGDGGQARRSRQKRQPVRGVFSFPPGRRDSAPSARDIGRQL